MVVIEKKVTNNKTKLDDIYFSFDYTYEWDTLIDKFNLSKEELKNILNENYKWSDNVPPNPYNGKIILV